MDRKLQSLHAARSFYIVLQDIDAAKHAAQNEDYKYKPYYSVIDALALLIRQYNLQTMPAKTGELRLWDPAELYKRFKAAMKVQFHKCYQQEPIDAIWAAGSDLILDEYLERTRQKSMSLSQDDRLPVHGDHQLVYLSKDVTLGIGLPSKTVHNSDCTPQQDLPTLRRASIDGQISINTSASPSSSTSIAGDAVTHQEQTLTSLQSSLNSDTPSEPSAERSSEESNSTLVNTDRRHESKHTHSSFGVLSQETDVAAAESTTYVSENDAHRKDSANTDSTLSSVPSYIDAAQPQAVCHKRSVNEAGFPVDSRDSTAQQVSIPRRSSSPFDINRTKSLASNISHSIGIALATLFDLLELPQDQPSLQFVTLPEELKPLFEMCFGLDWQNYYAELCSKRLRSVASMTAQHVLKALMGAFIYSRVWRDGATWQRALCEEIGFESDEALSGLLFEITSPHVERQQQGLKRFDELVARRLAQLGDEGVLLVRRNYSKFLVESLLNTLAPYIDQLAATAMSQNGLTTVVAWREPFYLALVDMIDEAVLLEIELSRSGNRHVFQWPSPSTVLDTKSMQPLLRPSHDIRHLVAYTMFPGITVESPTARKVLQLRHAEVVCRPDGQQEQQAAPVMIRTQPLTELTATRNPIPLEEAKQLRADIDTNGLQSLTPDEPGHSSSFTKTATTHGVDISWPPLHTLDSISMHIPPNCPGYKPLDLSNDPKRHLLHEQELKFATAHRMRCESYLRARQILYRRCLDIHKRDGR